jgi:hypothetical protein
MSPFPLMWFTSRTPILEGQTHCNMARYLGYHAGPQGTGWRRRQHAVPLATGTAVHAGLEALGHWLCGEPSLGAVPPAVLADIATTAAQDYDALATHKGLALSLGEPAEELQTLIREQRTLIEGLIWLWALVRLPSLLAEYRVLNVEQEETLILQCTCGLGDAVLAWQVHTARGCTGLVQMGRADWLLESRATGEVLYVEFKTKATPNVGWERAWEHSGQLLVNMEAASRRLGRPVSGAMIDVLYKGRRTGSVGYPKMQQSSLCYGIYEPGGLGSPGVWRPRKDREFWSRTVPVWDDSIPMVPCREGASRVETWVTRSASVLSSLLQVLGPFPRPHAMVEMALSSVRASEGRWQADVQDIRAGQASPETLIDRSWQCTSWDGTMCSFWPICNQEPGYESPGEMGLYEPRVPHHATEKQAAELAGAIFAEESTG